MPKVSDREERRRSEALRRSAEEARRRQFARLYGSLDAKPCDKCERCSKCKSTSSD